MTTPSVLIISEKNDAANYIADTLRFKKSGGHWEGVFEGRQTIMVATNGHLLELMRPNEVIETLSWDSTKDLYPIEPSFCMVPIEENGRGKGGRAVSKLNALKKVLKQVDEVIIATDSDREGEAIAWNILEHFSFRGSVRRAWLAAGLDKKSISHTMSNLKDPSETKGFFRASQARGRADWMYQLTTRLYTYLARRQCFSSDLAEGSGRDSVMSVGRVQTPAVNLIVIREKEIAGFVPRDHFKVSCEFDGSGQAILAQYKPIITSEVVDAQPPGVEWLEPTASEAESGKVGSPLFTDKPRVDAFKERLSLAGPSSTVTEYKESEKSTSPPKPFHLPAAIKALCKESKISSGLAQTVFEDLYEQGFTSYARTSKRDIPINLYEPEVRNDIFMAIAEVPGVESAVALAKDIHNGDCPDYKPFLPTSFSKGDMNHYGIIPTAEKVDLRVLNSMAPKKVERDKGKTKPEHTGAHMRAAYKLVAKQFVQCMLPPARYSVQTVVIEVPTEDLLNHATSRFSASFDTPIDYGWKSAFGSEAKASKSIEPVSKGSSVPLLSVAVDKKVTSPPPRYTEESFHEKLANVGRDVVDPKWRKILKNSEGIGTPASRKALISTIQARATVSVRNQAFYANPKGFSTMEVLPDWLKNPETTAAWEDFLVKITEEKDDIKLQQMRDTFVEKQKERLNALHKHLFDNVLPSAKESIRPLRKPSPKALKLLRSVEKATGKQAPKGASEDFRIASAFIDENISSLNTGPTEKQTSLIERIAKEQSLDPKTLNFETAKEASEFIDKHIGKMPPSPGQIKLAKELADELPVDKRPAENVFENKALCSKFIDKALTAKKKAKRGAKKPQAKSRASK